MFDTTESPHLLLDSSDQLIPLPVAALINPLAPRVLMGVADC